MPNEQSVTPPRTTVTASGIARLANVGRAAVSNWRRRYADFPSPVGGTPTSPSFDALEVEHWLRRHGRLHQANTKDWAWQHIESHQPAAHISDTLAIAGAFLLARADQVTATDTKLPTPRQLTTRLRTLDRNLATMVAPLLPPQWTPQLTTLLHTLDQLRAEQDEETAFEYLHSRYASSAQSMSGLANTPHPVADLMVTLAGPATHTFDFTSGTGSILRAAADQALRTGTTTRCYAQEINPKYALLTLLRLWFVHLRARRTTPEAEPPVVHIGDSLLADALPDLRADVVVANFPFGVHDWGHDRLTYDPRWIYGLPPRTEPELAWVQHALAHLRPGGTAVVLMPPAAASRPAGRRVRAELLRRGALRAVIALPAGLMPPTGIGLHIWILTQPTHQQPHSADLLVVDASTTSHDQPFADIVTTAWNAYRSSRYTELAGVHRAVPTIEVLDDQVDLTPQRHLPQAASITVDPTHLAAKVDDFDRLLDRIQSLLPRVQTHPTTPLAQTPQAAIVDLVRSGSITVLRTHSTNRSTSPTVEATVLTVTDVLSGSPATGSTNRPDHEPGPRIQPGDILVTTIGRTINAKVATPQQTGAELGPNLQLIRVDQARFDPWFVAGILTHTDNTRLAGRASSTPTAALRIDIKRLTIPVVLLAQQQAYGQAFRQLAEFRTTLDQAATAGAQLAREIGDGLASGTVSP